MAWEKENFDQMVEKDFEQIDEENEKKRREQQLLQLALLSEEQPN